MAVQFEQSLATWLAPLNRLVWVGVLFLGLPTLVYSLWLERGHSLLPLEGAIAVVSILGLLIVNAETAAVGLARLRFGPANQRRGLLRQNRAVSLPDRAVPWVPPQRLPFVSVVVLAYLPNEQDIILDTLTHWLTCVESPTTGWEVILAYNTPVALPIETQLQQMARRFPDLTLLRVESSTSKAENLNAALGRVRGGMTCIFDADHCPAPDCLMRAWAWLEKGNYDGVQGRNVIRNEYDNWLTRLIAVEFDCIYNVSHYGRSLLVDTALFGGSNGYWRTQSITVVGFRQGMLTEDIDATLRALLRGQRIVHDPHIVTTELAPTNLRSLWLQRQRWSQGWIEANTQHLGNVWRSPCLDLYQKTCWVIMLLYSQYFHPLIWQTVPIALSIDIVDPRRLPTLEVLNGVIMGALTVTLFLQVITAAQVTLPLTQRSHRWSSYLLYCVLSPLYFWFKSLIALVALYNHLRGRRSWHVTQRSSKKLAPASR
ncbi:MAG: glycosyltransferase [Leptolyngbyaceae cyanobacterium T60_A2020_046]|nr:glycosyltransferase [Leptolyngbyaceae cyanobacterium T60_A2020_046]